ncbi:SGNH/GDSL hydrolase family protein [Amycolatopsis sp. NPDC059021]|uniref:SGNH/GDSL hydrolase family protein n=1 Tax=Amycolatopsis sp. NPDC059021 TaxID=3346704 RepID=UPI00366CD332
MRIGGRTTALAAIAAITFGTLAGPASAATATEYVALGDSAAAGPLIPPQDPASYGCLRSLVDYPHVVAKKIGAAKLTDVTCSGAKTVDLSGSQPTFTGPAAPQLDALSSRTSVVTLTIGANDVGLVPAVLSCLNLAPGVQPDCVDRYTAGGHDQLAESIADFEPKWGAAISAIAKRAPKARISVVGYGTYLPHNGCWPVAPLSARDADYIQKTIGELDAALARQAAAHGARFLDIRGVTSGHDVCQAPGVKWYESLVPTAIAAPLHPNEAGMAGIGAYVAGKLARN